MSTDAKRGQDATPGIGGLNVILVSCALVVTGHLLGVSWLSETVLALPAGIWFIGLVTAIFSPALRRRIAGAADKAWALVSPGSGCASPLSAGPIIEPRAAGWWPSGPLGSACIDLGTRVASILARIALIPVRAPELAPLGRMRVRTEEWLESLPWPTRPLRVGLHMPDEEAEAIIAAHGACRTEWFRLPRWEDPQAACRRHLFDAVVYHDGEGPVRIVTLERPHRAAGVVEWADLQGGLTFGSLFPARVDPAAVVVEGATRTRVREGADLLRALVESAATLARSAHRLTLPDLMLGRRVTDAVDRPAGLSLWRSPRPVAATVLDALASAAAERAHAWPEAAAVASRVAGGYFVSCPGLAPSDRAAAITRAAAGSPEDATAALRLGAACIGALEDERGLEWLVKADVLIRRGRTPLVPLDHAAFLESELVHGTDDPMSVGRAAAGICMVCAATPTERIPFVRDDMLEEMAYAGWLVGRDQDRGLLISVFLEIEHAHAAAEGRAARRGRGRDRRTQATAA